MSTKGTEIKCGPRESQERSYNSSCLQKRAKKSTLRESTVDACNEKDPSFKKVIETQKELKDTEEFEWLESTELAIDKRKFLLNSIDCIKSSPFHKLRTSPTRNVMIFREPLYCCVSIKTVNNQTLTVFYCSLDHNNNNDAVDVAFFSVRVLFLS